VVAASAAAGPHLLPIMDMIMGCKKIVGVVEGGTSAQSLVPKLIDLYLAGRFPFDRLVEFYDLDQVNDAARDSTSGKAIKPILKCSHPV
jgi:aryl-alcohol dehydrogenase